MIASLQSAPGNTAQERLMTERQEIGDDHIEPGIVRGALREPIGRSDDRSNADTAAEECQLYQGLRRTTGPKGGPPGRDRV